MRACACGERSTAMCSMCGITMSPAYLSAPDTLLGASMRRTLAPMKAPSAGSSSASALAGRRPLLHVARQLDRVENLLVAGAAADVAAEPLLDLLAIGERIGAQRRGRRHHHAGDAIAALAGARLVERLLQHRQLAGLGQPLDRLDRRRPAPWRPARGRTSAARRRRTPSRCRIRRRRSLPWCRCGRDRRAGSRAAAGAAWRCARSCGR